MSASALRLVFIAPFLLIACAIVVAALYLGSMADDSDLLPAGEYASFEDAEKATAFDIPRPRDTVGWRLERIEVKGGEYGLVLGEGNVSDLAVLRFVSYTYRHVATDVQINFAVYPAENNLLEPAGGSVGPAQEIQISDKLAILQTQDIGTNTGASFVTIQWLDDGLHVSAHAFLMSGLTIDALLAFLSSVD